MGLNNDDHSGEFCRAINAGERSNWDGDSSPPAKNKDGLQRAASQSNSLPGISSFQNISSANVESRMQEGTSYQPCAYVDIEMIKNKPSCQTSAEESLFSRPSFDYGQRNDQKGLESENDGNLSNRRANDAAEVFCSVTNEDDKSASCGLHVVNSSDQGVEAVVLPTAHGSPSLSSDNEDRCLESRKQNQLTGGTSHNLSSSSSMKCQNQDEKVIQSNKETDSDEMHDPHLQTSAEDDTDDSDVEEEDVKVCDICGDAGREDLLAVCSRCSDGAEHTYCMREMLDKVPEADWLCEECKFNEELETQKQEHSKLPDTNEKSKFLGRTSSINSDLSFKSDNKYLFGDRNKMKSVNLNKQVSSKRSIDGNEAGLTPKRQALESSMGSPTASSPSRVAVLSKDNSFRSLDKKKGKPTNQISNGTESVVDFPETPSSPTTSSLHTSKGNFVKSNSFGSGNTKLNVKVLDEVPQKQKQGVDAKDMPGKLIGKSMSFKGLGRSTVSEPKVKMLSPKCTPIQDLKGQKQGRERNSFERKNSIKLDSSFPGMAATSGKRPRGDNISTLSVINSRDNKNAQSDGKVSTLTKQACLSLNKSSDASANIGDAKRPSSASISISSSVSGTSSSAQAKPSNLSLKEGPVLNSPRIADRSVIGANGSKADVLDNQSEKTFDSSFGRSRPGVNAGMVGGNRRAHSVDASISRTKEGIHEENKLKAAIEAAMQKKQDIFKKNRIPEKSNELSTSITQGNHVGDAVSNLSKAAISEEAMHDGDAALCNNILDTCKQTSISSSKLLKVYPADCLTSLNAESLLTASPIPEHEAVWQGGFEIHRTGKFSDICGGFQAHLSSIASGKVIEVVKKFPQKIVLDEVPRPCAWPQQFKGIGARENNIALYFFAKDHESFVRSYKILLDYLMKHDLALRGNINGVELLVFPSNHLPDKSQCWNAFFFMWGVFRGRRSLCSDNRSGSLEMHDISMPNLVPLDKDVSSAASPENSFLHRPAVEDLSVSGSSHLVVSRCEAPGSFASTLGPSGSPSNGDCNNQRSYGGRTSLSSETRIENSQRMPENHSPGLGAEACSESGRAVLKDHYYEDPNVVKEHQRSTEDFVRGNHPQEAKKSQSYLTQDKPDISSPFQLPLVADQDCGSVVSSVEQQVLDTVDIDVDKAKSEISCKQEHGYMENMKNHGGEMKLEDDVKQEEEERKNDKGKLNLDGSLKQEGVVDINVSADGNIEEFHSLQFSPKRNPHVDSIESTSQAPSVMTSQKRPWKDRKDPLEGEDQASTAKRVKGGDGLYGCDLNGVPSSVSDRPSAQMGSVSSSSHREDVSNQANDQKSPSARPESAERYFFLVDSLPAPSMQSGDNSLPWKVSLSENEDRLPDGSPNLELALGVEKNQSRKGVLPFFAGIADKKDSDRPPDIATSLEEDEDSSASLSLSLAFPFSDKERPTKIERPSTSVEQALAGRHEVNTSLLLFRGSSRK